MYLILLRSQPFVLPTNQLLQTSCTSSCPNGQAAQPEGKRGKGSEVTRSQPVGTERSKRISLGG